MASVSCGNSWIDYNISTGEVYGVVHNGVELLDKWGYPEDMEIIEKDGWKEALVQIVKDCGLNKPSKYGLGAYIYCMQEKGLL